MWRRTLRLTDTATPCFAACACVLQCYSHGVRYHCRSHAARRGVAHRRTCRRRGWQRRPQTGMHTGDTLLLLLFSSSPCYNSTAQLVDTWWCITSRAFRSRQWGVGRARRRFETFGVHTRFAQGRTPGAYGFLISCNLTGYIGPNDVINAAQLVLTQSNLVGTDPLSDAWTSSAGAGPAKMVLDMVRVNPRASASHGPAKRVRVMIQACECMIACGCVEAVVSVRLVAVPAVQ